MALIDLVKENLEKCTTPSIPEGVSTISELAEKLGVSEQEVICSCNILVQEGKIERLSIEKDGKFQTVYKEITKEATKK